MGQFGKDKDDNVITLEEVLENDSKSVEDIVDTKIKVNRVYEKIKEVLKCYLQSYYRPVPAGSGRDSTPHR